MLSRQLPGNEKAFEIMAELFRLDHKDILKLREFYNKAPRKYSMAAGMVLNQFAYGTYENSTKAIMWGLTIRKYSLIRWALRYEKTSTRVPINAMESSAYSIRRGKFTGWDEQETGRKTERTRVASLLARGQKTTGQIGTPYRLYRGRKFLRPDDYPGKSSHHRAQMLLLDLARVNWKDPFVVWGHKRMPPGLYKFRGRKTKRGMRRPMLLQSFDPQRVQPRAYKWMTISRNWYFQENTPIMVWKKVLKHKKLNKL